MPEAAATHRLTSRSRRTGCARRSAISSPSTASICSAARQLLRLPRPERRGQVHDDQVPDRPAAADRRHVPDSRHRSARRSRGGQAQGRRRARRSRAVRSADRRRDARVRRPGARPRRRRRSRARSEELLDADGPRHARRTTWSPTTRTACARRSRWRPRCCPRRACCSSTSRSRASTPSRRGRSRICSTTFVRGGGTVFLTSHILEIVERLCDHIGIIHAAGWSRRDRWPSCAAASGRRSRSASSSSSARERAAAPALDWLA